MPTCLKCNRTKDTDHFINGECSACRIDNESYPKRVADNPTVKKTTLKYIQQCIPAINQISHNIRLLNDQWWRDLQTNEYIARNVGELLCLVHSEISEAMEGYRKNLNDDKLPHRKMFEVELADAMIRILDLAGEHKLDLGGAIYEKLVYNTNRIDHTREHRQTDEGKKF